MKKFIILLAACALFGAGCTVTRQGGQFVISSASDGTVIEGTQAGAGLSANLAPSLSIGAPAEEWSGLSLPMP